MTNPTLKITKKREKGNIFRLLNNKLIFKVKNSTLFHNLMLKKVMQ